jgi:hypothetical protein
MTETTRVLDDQARWGIHDLQARYVIALDSDDAEAVAELFLEDGTMETHERVFRGPDGIRKMLRHAPKGLHLGGHSVVEATSFGASARQQLVFVDASDHSLRLALYDDEMVETEQGWRYRRRICQFLVRDGSLSPLP